MELFQIGAKYTEGEHWLDLEQEFLPVCAECFYHPTEASISLHGWGDTQWPINTPPLLSSSHVMCC